MVARNSSMIKLVLPTIKYVLAPLEVCPEFEFNLEADE
jgi:hypothetical protein